MTPWVRFEPVPAWFVRSAWLGAWVCVYGACLD
jgi:hypothetical protein